MCTDVPVMTEEWVRYFRDQFPAKRLHTIADEVLRLGGDKSSYEKACRKSQYNHINNRWAQCSNKVYTRLQGVVKRRRDKLKRQRDKKDKEKAERELMEMRPVLKDLTKRILPLKRHLSDLQNK